MNIEKRFIQIRNFLKAHENLLQTEVLESDLSHLKDYIPWAEEYLQLSTTNKISCEFSLDYSDIENPDFKSFIQTVNDLIQLPKNKRSTQKIPVFLTRKLSQKKTHELLQIKESLKFSNISHIIDIGGGAGHLISYLIFNNDKQATSYDLEESYQNIGKKKLARYAPEVLKRIDFKTEKINENSTFGPHKNSLLIGLHACGDLSTTLIKKSTEKNFAELLSLGCCYHKCTQKELNISKRAQTNPLQLSFHALTMAAKTFKVLDHEQFIKRQQVKDFRYTLHLISKQKLGLGFTTLGNAKPADYQGCFSDYAFKYLEESKQFTKSELDTFFSAYQKDVRLIQALGSIRSMLARIVEMYILLDRALFLRENHFNVEISEIFDPEISPRNIALYAKAKN